MKKQNKNTPPLFVEQGALGLATSRNPSTSELQEALLDNERILTRYPPEQMARSIWARASLKKAHTSTNRSTSKRLWLAGATASAAALFLAFLAMQSPVLQTQAINPTSAGAAERIKGDGPRLLLFRQQGSDAERLEDQSLVQAGDSVQLAVEPRGLPYNLVFSVDGAGAVTRHLPAAGPAERIAASRYLLPFAYKLDNAPAFERFFLVSSLTPFAWEDLDPYSSHWRDAQTVLPLSAPRSGQELRVFHVVLRKESL